MTARKRLSPTARVKNFHENKGICCLCGGKIDGAREKWICEHITALGLLGEDGGDNIKPAHKRCADAKTFGPEGDLAMIAKAKRREARHIGADRPAGRIQSRGFPTPLPQKNRASAPVQKWTGWRDE